MIEVKREALHGEGQDREWRAYKAGQDQAASEGRLATDDDYEELRRKCREILEKAPAIRAECKPKQNSQRGGKSNESTGAEPTTVQASGS